MSDLIISNFIHTINCTAKNLDHISLEIKKVNSQVWHDVNLSINDAERLLDYLQNYVEERKQKRNNKVNDLSQYSLADLKAIKDSANEYRMICVHTQQSYANVSKEYKEEASKQEKHWLNLQELANDEIRERLEKIK
jgi:hypothetical protein